jgi:hypothetical protein
MPLNTIALKKTLESKIKEALDAPIDNESDSNSVKQKLAQSLSEAIADSMETWIKTATITVQPGQVVTTPVGPGSVTTPGTATIS